MKKIFAFGFIMVLASVLLAITPLPAFNVAYTIANGTNTVTADGTPFSMYAIQMNTDLTVTNGWVSFQTNRATSTGKITFVFTMPLTNSAMFFRLQSL
jgi:hypothetical protein